MIAYFYASGSIIITMKIYTKNEAMQQSNENTSIVQNNQFFFHFSSFVPIICNSMQ